MKIVCTGCSYTHGSELWEEQFLYGYTEIKDKTKASKVSNASEFGGDLNAERHSLAYSGYIQKALNCEVINLAEGGNCQHNIVQKAITELGRLKQMCSGEDIICILQNTFPDRFMVKSRFSNENESIVSSHISNYYHDDWKIAVEIGNIRLTYMKDDMILSEYYMQILAMQKFCRDNGIGFFTFFIQDPTILYPEDATGLYDLIKTGNCMQMPMIQKLEQHYNGSKFTLPGGHPNTEAHKVIGKWIVEELKEKGLI
jgi:hypothetical protein